jgi:hypothetical protein
MRSVQDTTWERFTDAVLSDDDLGYPDDVAFVSADAEWADQVLWRYLTSGRPTVLVSDASELLLLPSRRRLRDRLTGHVRVTAQQRTHEGLAPYATRSVLGNRPVRQMRELAAAS